MIIPPFQTFYIKLFPDENLLSALPDPLPSPGPHANVDAVVKGVLKSGVVFNTLK